MFEFEYRISFESASAKDTEELLDCLRKMGITMLTCVGIRYIDTDDGLE